MKTKIIITFLGLLFIAGAFGEGCDETNSVESNCGTKQSRSINSSGMTDVHQLSVLSGSQIATATWRMHSSLVCTYEHVVFDIEVEVNAAYADTFTVQSSVLLNPLYIPQIPLTKSINWETGNAFYRGSDDVGLKQVFGEGPGEFTYYLDLSFPSTGNTNQDTEFINQAVKKVTILCSFYYHK